MSNPWLMTIDDEKPALQKADKLYISVPGELVCSLVIELPVLPTKNREQVVGYALEDKIAAHLDDIKIIIFPSTKGKTTVLWCLQAQWERWLQKIEQFHMPEPEALLPDYLYLPLEMNAWTIRTHENRTLLRTDAFNGLTLENELFIELLSLKLDQALELPTTLIYEGGPLLEPLTHLCTQYGLSLIQKKLPFFSIPRDSRLSLLPQKKFHWKQIPRSWKIAGILAITWITLLIIGFSWQHRALNQAIKKDQQQLATLYHRVDPIHEIPEGWVEQLPSLQRNLKNSLHKETVITHVMMLNQILTRYPGIELKSFDVTAQKIELQINASSMKIIDTLVTQLKKQKWHVRQMVDPSLASSPFSSTKDNMREIHIQLRIEVLS